MYLKKGALWERLVRTTEQALARGALAPVPTDYSFLEDRGIQFVVRVLANLHKKDEARTRQKTESRPGEVHNPFLSPEKELIVTDISDTHLAILNKYSVVDHHLLIATRKFEDQSMLLTLNDFNALWLCMSEYNSLGFYNAGPEAGASQRHKHLQLIPVPFIPTGQAVPIETLLPHSPVNRIMNSIPGLSFLHAFVRLEQDLVFSPDYAAKKTYELYAKMLASLGLEAPEENRSTRQSMPYNFLVTCDWLLLVPRSREFFGDISLNALAYAGSFFVRNEQQLAFLKTQGPMKALSSVGLQKKA